MYSDRITCKDCTLTRFLKRKKKIMVQELMLLQKEKKIISVM